MTRNLTVSIVCLRVTSIDPERLQELNLQEYWKLAHPPNFLIKTAEPGYETDLHIPRVDISLSQELAASLDSPWGIDVLSEPIVRKLKEICCVHTVVVNYEVNN